MDYSSWSAQIEELLGREKEGKVGIVGEDILVNLEERADLDLVPSWARGTGDLNENCGGEEDLPINGTTLDKYNNKEWARIVKAARCFSVCLSVILILVIWQERHLPDSWFSCSRCGDYEEFFKVDE